MAIKIYTDACSNLFSALLKEKNIEIEVLPMELKIGEKTYLCYSDDINVSEFSKDFYQEMRNGKKPRTSLINPQMFFDKMEKEVKDGNQVIYVSMSSHISGTYQAAFLSAMDINDNQDKKMIHIIDSKTAGFGEGLIAMKCAQMVKEGLSFEEIIEKGEEYVQRVRSEFSVDDLKYLCSSGRITKLIAAVASVLSIKPLLYGSEEGKIEVTSKCHGRNKAIRALAAQVIKNIKNPEEQTVYISHCDSVDDANRLKDMLIEGGIKNIEVYYYDLISGSHVGPGTLAVFYEGENRKI